MTAGTVSSAPPRDSRGDFSPLGAGLLLAAALGGWQLLWAGIVAIGWGPHAVELMDWLHFIRPVRLVDDTDGEPSMIVGTAAAAIEFCVGYTLARLWNRLG